MIPRKQLSLAIALGLLVGGEIAVRASRVTDVPLYRSDGAIGYIPVASQSGAHLWRNSWAFNDHGMGVARPFTLTHPSLLLVGDSLVLGGNALSQTERLGPRLQGLLGQDVWPISAGSWSLFNELNALQADPAITGVDTIVFVLNSKDFEEASAWSNELTHPRHRPLCATCWLGARLFLRPAGATTPGPWPPLLASFRAGYRGRVVFVLYPTRAELLAGVDPFVRWRRDFPASIQIIELALKPAWNASLYRDPIHPTADGNRVLATILTTELTRPRRTPR